MEELFKIRKTEKGNQVVSARELHSFLGIGADFTNWCKRMFEYGFENSIDYTIVKIGEPDNQVVVNPKPKIDYVLTLDCAKEIAMIQRSDKGKQARLYFIECEKRLREVYSLPQSFTEALRVLADTIEKEEKISLSKFV